MQRKMVVPVLILAGILLAGCVTTLPVEEGKPTAILPTPTSDASALQTEKQRLLASLKSQGPAPALSNEIWINSEPLALEDLRGNVVIVEFWTYG